MADTDESYVIPLQKKFAELFADKIDLEIITDKDYFNQLFSLSQHADILLVSDTLYNSGLKKHDIRHLMILSEHYEPGQTDELDICRLFKYTSVRQGDALCRTGCRKRNKDHIDHLGVRRSRENECCIRLVSLSGT